MINRMAPRFWHRCLAWAIAGTLAVGALLLMAAPAVNAWFSRHEVREQIRSNIQRIEQRPLDARLDVSELVSSMDGASAALELQTVLQSSASESGFEPSILRALGYQDMGEHQTAWVELRGDVDLQALLEFLAALERHRPIILVREVSIVGEGAQTGDGLLSIRLEAGLIFDAAAS